jgi:hypothetical protein
MAEAEDMAAVAAMVGEGMVAEEGILAAAGITILAVAAPILMVVAALTGLVEPIISAAAKALALAR